MAQISDRKNELVEMGIRLKELRDIKGKSQKEAAGDLDLKQSVLSSYELGDREPSILTLNKIAQYYNVSVDYLTGNSKYKSLQHEKLYNVAIFSQDTIDELNALSPEDLSFLETILCTDSFYSLLAGLKRYQDISFDEIEKYGKSLFGENTIELKLRIALSKYEIKKDILRPFLDRAIQGILLDLDEIEHVEAHKEFEKEINKSIEQSKSEFSESLLNQGIEESKRIEIIKEFEKNLKKKLLRTEV